MRVLAEEEELVLGRQHRLHPRATGPLDDAAQQLARRDFERPAVHREKVDQEETDARLPRDHPERVQIDAGQRIRVAGVPARDLDVVVEHVGAVPAEDDVAEPEARLHGRPELVERDVLPAQDAVDVKPADLDLVDLVLGEGVTE